MHLTSLRRAGFTLFEVGISLMIVSVAVITVLLLLPVGVKAQQMSRYQLYAAIKANELIETFSQSTRDMYASYINDGSMLWDDNESRVGGKYGTPSQFDLERLSINSTQGNYPVPLSIAGRLDSAGNEIQKILDGGGQIFYCDPFPSKNFSQGESAIGDKRNASPELQKLIWGVAGYAAQNLLPNDIQIPYLKEFWPFPPQSKSYPLDRRYGRDLSNALKVVTTQDRVDENPAYQRKTGLYQGNNWEWLAHCDKTWNGGASRWNGVTSVNPSPWIAALPEFRRMTNYHWLRIVHQLSAVHKGSYGEDPRLSGGGDLGLPAPANGLPYSKNRGTDILYEDHETWDYQWSRQLRRGMPSLQRRVMYRTAALALWAKVARAHIPGGYTPIDINEHPLTDIGTASDTHGLAWDPNVAGNVANFAALNGANLNPLAAVIPPPNPGDIHPTQVLALSYLAHAAMLVTGYKPPFIAKTRHPDIGGGVAAVPFRAESDLVFGPESAFSAYDRPYAALAKQAIASPAQEYSYVRDIYHNSGAQLTDVDAANPAKRYLFQIGADGNPIKYRRITWPVLARQNSFDESWWADAWVINPFPPPYADRGAFDMNGKCSPTAWPTDSSGGGGLTPSPIDAGASYWRKWQGDNYVAVGMDTIWARNAHETFMRWAMAYVSENPYDLIVPRPYNRQVMTDRPMLCWDLFNPTTGNAIRSGQAVYSMLFGSNRYKIGASWASPTYIDSAHEYAERNGAYVWPTNVPRPIPDADLPPAGLQLGYPNTNALNESGVNRGYARQQGLANAIRLAHGQSVAGNDNYNHQDGRDWRSRYATLPNSDRYWYNNPFAPAQRCRQIIFWSADWKSYEDSETAPSAPIDRYQLGRTEGRIKEINLDSKGMPPESFEGSFDMNFSGNPEQNFVWANPERDGTLIRPPPAATFVAGNFSDVSSNNNIRGVDRGDVYDSRHPGIFYTFGSHFYWQFTSYSRIRQDWPEWSVWWTLAHWGADRNQNGVLDIGPIPATSRMRAAEVARFNYYDPVGWTTIRN